MSTWTDEKHKAARARCARATEGPWDPWLDQDGADHMNGMLMVGNAAAVIPDGATWVDGVDVNPVAHVYTPEDRAFIAHARTDLPALLDEIERLRALTTITDDMVEKAASAAYENLAAQDPRWNEVNGDTEFATLDGSFHFLETMHAALEAALNPKEIKS